MTKIDWYYRRNNCETCAKSDADLARRKLTPQAVQDARKNRIPKAEALQMARKMRRIIATKGRSVIEIDVSQAEATNKALAAAIIGPSGNLRAPTIRVADTLVVGFAPEIYARVLKAASGAPSAKN